MHSVSVLSRIMGHFGSFSDSADGTGDVCLQPGWDKWWWSLLGAVLTSLCPPWEQQLLRAGTAGEIDFFCPFLWVIRASMEVKMNKSCTVSACQKPHKGQMWAITVHCVCQRRAKLTAFTPGFLPRSELFLSCDPDTLVWTCTVWWFGSREGSGFCSWLCLFFFPTPYFN